MPRKRLPRSDGVKWPAISMNTFGSLVLVEDSELQQANLKEIAADVGEEGESGPKDEQILTWTDMGSCEIYPQTISHNSNGRFVVVCGDGEYIIYTEKDLTLRKKGSAHEFVWALDSSEYAIRENSVQVKIFNNFKERTSFKPDFGVEGIFGGHMLGVKSVAGLSFYEWDSLDLICRIEIQPKNVYWSENGEQVAIATEDSFFILKYRPEDVAKAKESPEAMTEDGYEDAFDVLKEVHESVKTGLWVGDFFFYTNSDNSLNNYVEGEIVTIAHLNKSLYLIGYIPEDSFLYLTDKELDIFKPIRLLLPVLDYQTAVMRGDFEAADKIFSQIPKDQRSRVAQILEETGSKRQALAASTDPENKFELALILQDTKTAYYLASEAPSEYKWRQLAELAMSQLIKVYGDLP